MVSEPESKKIGIKKKSQNWSPKYFGFGSEKNSLNQSETKYPNQSQNFRMLVLIWVPVSSRSRDFCNFFMVSEPVSKKFGSEKSLGTGLEKNEYRKNLVLKKISESVSKNFGTEKKSWNRSRKNLVPKKSLGIGIVHILGLVTHWHLCQSLTRSVKSSSVKNVIFRVCETTKNVILL